MEAINPDLRELWTSFSQQTIWQLLGFAIIMASVMITGIYYQTNALRNEFNQRFDSLQREMNLRFEAQQQQMIQMEKNLTTRFEDLRQDVRGKRK